MSGTIINTDDLLKVLGYMNLLNVKGALYTGFSISADDGVLKDETEVYTLEEVINNLAMDSSDLVKTLQEKIEELEEENSELVRKNQALACSVVLLSS